MLHVSGGAIDPKTHICERHVRRGISGRGNTHFVRLALRRFVKSVPTYFGTLDVGASVGDVEDVSVRLANGFVGPRVAFRRARESRFDKKRKRKNGGCDSVL